LPLNRRNNMTDTNNIWTQVGADIDGEAGYDQSGRSVAMSADGSRIAIGAFFNSGVDENGNSLFMSGHVRVYDLSGGSWTQVGADIDGEDEYDQSGYSVAMSADGSRIAIGAIDNDGSGNSLPLSGHVRVYDLSGGSWTQVGTDCNRCNEK
jgi:hypothetical protein